MKALLLIFIVIQILQADVVELDFNELEFDKLNSEVDFETAVLTYFCKEKGGTTDHKGLTMVVRCLNDKEYRITLDEKDL